MARRRKLFNIISLLPSTIPHRSTGKQRGMGATAELDDLIFCWNGSGPPWSMTWTSSSCLEMCLAQQWVRLGRVHLTINKFIASAMAWTPASRFFMCLAQEEVWLGGPHLVFDTSGTTGSMTWSSPSCLPGRMEQQEAWPGMLRLVLECVWHSKVYDLGDLTLYWTTHGTAKSMSQVFSSCRGMRLAQREIWLWPNTIYLETRLGQLALRLGRVHLVL